MKSITRLAALLGILGVTLWAGTVRPAYALPLCDTLHGSACSSPGTKTSCTTSDGFTSSCTCTTGRTWRCLL